MRTPGFLGLLQTQLESLPFSDLERINRVGGVEVRDLIELLLHPKDHTVYDPCEIDTGKIFTVEDAEEKRLLGAESLVSGVTAVCLIANENCLRIISGLGITALEAHVLRVAFAKHLWVIVPYHLLGLFLTAVEKFKYRKPDILPQHESICLTPDNQIYYEEGLPVFHPCGSGDAISVLRNSDRMRNFLKEGGRHIIFTETDNVLGIPTPDLIYDHIESKSPITCIVTTGETKDTLPVVCEHAGFDQVVERFRFSSYVEIEQFKMVFTGTMIVDASLDFDTVNWTWHRRKCLQGKSLVIQYKRYMQDLTSTFRTRFVFRERKNVYASTLAAEVTSQV